jgi:hypothetical protein
LNQSLTFVLPDGTAAVVPLAVARSIADLLWDMGLAPGAATAATRIMDAVGSANALRARIEFPIREEALVRQACDGTLAWRLQGA